MAEDGGNPPMFSKASLSIKIVNVNDNAPQFKNTTYERKISEDTRIGTTILTVTAIDPDGLDEDFFYSIEQTSNQRSCFQIDQFSGAIFLRSCTLDFKKEKEYRLKLKVTDTDDRFGYANLIIRIYDANNNAPRYDYNCLFQIYLKKVLVSWNMLIFFLHDLILLELLLQLISILF